MDTYDWNGYLLAFQIAAPDTDPVNLATMKRPNFREETKRYFYDFMAGQNRVLSSNALGDLLVTTCQACGQPGAAADMDLGHKKDWKKYLADKRVRTKSEAIAAYNDLNNLRLEHACCNRSHRFEDLEGDDPHPDGARIFEELIGATENPDSRTSAYYTINDRDNLNLLLAEPIVAHGVDREVDWSNIKRPKWDKSTRAGLIQLWKNFGMTKKAPIADGEKDLTWFQCASCRKPGLGHDMHIGHIVNWVKYLKSKDVTTIAEAQWAYNDLNNLQFEHAKCNLGHEWEDYDPDDKDFSYGPNDMRDIEAEMDDFIVPVRESEAADWRERSGFNEYMAQYDRELQEKLAKKRAEARARAEAGPIHILIPRRKETRLGSVVKNPDTRYFDDVYDQLDLTPPPLPEEGNMSETSLPQTIPDAVDDDLDDVADSSDGKRRASSRRSRSTRMRKKKSWAGNFPY